MTREFVLNRIEVLQDELIVYTSCFQFLNTSSIYSDDDMCIYLYNSSDCRQSFHSDVVSCSFILNYFRESLCCIVFVYLYAVLFSCFFMLYCFLVSLCRMFSCTLHLIIYYMTTTCWTYVYVIFVHK